MLLQQEYEAGAPVLIPGDEEFARKLQEELDQGQSVLPHPSNFTLPDNVNG
jgi:hypothetical protein